MGFLKKQFTKSRESYTKWKKEAPARDRARINVAKRRLEMEKQRAEIMRQKVSIAKAQSETRKYSQQFRGGGFGGSMSMQPSGFSNASYFAPKVTQPITKKATRKSKKKRRKK